MASHDELVAEMPILEQMGTQERQKLAKKRRMQQLKKWSQREKHLLANEMQLSRRLANIYNEENNGINLEQYTTYSSDQRSGGKQSAGSKSNSSIKGTDPSLKREQKFLNNNYRHNNNNSSHNSNSNGKSNYFPALKPNESVYFDAGVILLEAAARNDYDEVERLLSNGVSPDSVNHDGLTALHQCCIDASEPMMNLLLEYGANVDARDNEQWTPLHAACTCGHLNLVKILVEHGADLLAVNGDGNMPFDICEDESTLDYIESQMVARGITQEMIDSKRATNEMQMLSDLEKLVADKCDPNFVDSSGVSQLHIAAANNYLSVVKFLIKHGVNINACDNDQWRPLHGVACWGNEQHIKVAELLVESGASLDAKTSNDETIFDLCDNIDLQERLNQLKDELESKQATGTGRLKRTQSKTNSRIHSVRRTSVRDKNQISRREAREEAMLRVESNETLNNGEQKRVPTGESSETPSSESSPSKSGVPLSRGENGASSRDQVDFHEPTETDLDCDPAVDQVKRLNNEPVLNGDGTSKLEENGDSEQTTSGSLHQEVMQTNHNTDNRATTDNANESSAKTISPSGDTSRVQISAPQITNGGQVPSTTRATSDLTGKAPQSTIVQVHFTPMNYTLSNLKKHRSDMRMRSVSGGILPNATAVKLTRQHELSDGNSSNGPTSLQGINEISLASDGSNGVETATFKKFHGEPSGVIEFTDRRRRHECCIIS